MKRIAIIFDGSLSDRKGLINAVLNRAKFLIDAAKDIKIDIYNFQSYDNWLVRKLRHTEKSNIENNVNIDGMNISIFWHSFSLFDYILTTRFKQRSFFAIKAYKKKSKLFKNYELISAHSINCGRLALEIHNKYGIPYVVTWHGSDIHTAPFNNPYIFEDVYNISEKASCNFFVSNALCATSEKINKNIIKTILYNGVSEDFYRYSDNKRIEIRKKYGVENKKVICFAGNVIAIKNPLVLPQIFKNIRDKYNKNEIAFWILGDGRLRPQVEKECNNYNLICTFWGNIISDKMPEMLNCVDIQILPSKNEGLPLITIEALKCGANVVGSNVGGISEAIGKDNVFNLDSDFVSNISDRIIYMLENNFKQPLSGEFDWKITAKKEYSIYQGILS